MHLAVRGVKLGLKSSSPTGPTNNQGVTIYFCSSFFIAYLEAVNKTQYLPKSCIDHTLILNFHYATVQ